MLARGLARHEETTAELEPVAARVVELAAIRPGGRVLDVGCTRAMRRSRLRVSSHAGVASRSTAVRSADLRPRSPWGFR